MIRKFFYCEQNKGERNKRRQRSRAGEHEKMKRKGRRNRGKGGESRGKLSNQGTGMRFLVRTKDSAFGQALGSIQPLTQRTPRDVFKEVKRQGA
jgi:hypothetical protein